MSPRSPASHLAKLKLEHPTWTLRAVARGKGTGYTAQKRDAHGNLRSLYAPTLIALEKELEQAGSGSDGQ